MLSLLSVSALLLQLSAIEPLLHLRADSGVVVDADGRVIEWNDVGNGTKSFRNPSGASNTVVLEEKAINGRPSVRFNGYGVLVDTSSLALDSAGFTVLIVAEDESPEAYSAVLNKGRGDLSVDLWGGAAGNFQVSVAWVQTMAKTSYQTAEPMLYEASWSLVESKLYTAGKLVATGGKSPVPSRNKKTYLGAAFEGGWQGFFTGKIGELIVYPGVLDDTVRVRLESELLNRWKISRLGSIGYDSGLASQGNLMLHLMADSGLELDSKGAVKSWRDLSPRNGKFIALNEKFNPDSSLRPKCNNFGINGRSVVEFSGRQILLDASYLPLDSGFTLFFVAKDFDVSNASAFLNKESGDISIDLWNGDAGNFQVSQAWVESLAKTTFISNSAEVYEASWGTSDADLYVSGVLVAANRAAVPVNLKRNQRTWLGGVYHAADGGLSHFFSGEVGEVVIYRGVLSDSMRIIVRTRLMQKWGVSNRVVSLRKEQSQRGVNLRSQAGEWIIQSKTWDKLVVYGITGRLLYSGRFKNGFIRFPKFKEVSVMYLQSNQEMEVQKLPGIDN